MELRDWVKERFGTTDTETLIDESVYSRDNLRKDKAKLEQSLRQLESEMDKHAKKYEKLLQKGSDADELSRQQYAQKAKFEKKKYEIKKKKHKAESIKLGTVISIEGMREVLAMQDGQDYELDRLFDGDLDAQELQSQVMDEMAQFGLEIDDMKQVQEALDIEIIDQDLETGVSEELEIMEEMAAGDISEEQIDIEENVDIEEEDINLSVNQPSRTL